MYILKNIIGAFLLPPGIFILILILYSLWLIFKRKNTHALSFLFLGILAWALSISPFSDALIGPLESEFNIPKDPKGDVIILLSAGISNEMPDLSGHGAPSIEMMHRVIAALRLQKMCDTYIIISGRGNHLSKNSTASVLRRFLGELGIPRDKIIVEDRSKDTYENVYFSSKICREYGFQNPMLVTSAYHMKRAIQYFNDAGLEVIPFPAGFETWKGKRYTWQSFLPDDYRKSSIAMHEYLGLLYYRLIKFTKR